jgi:hypothetical protein
LIEFAPPRQLNRCAEQLRHVFRLTIHDEQNVSLDFDLREFLGALLWKSSFGEDCGFGAITFSR